MVNINKVRTRKMVLRIFTKEIQIKIKRIICKKIGLTARKESGVMNVNRQK